MNSFNSNRLKTARLLAGLSLRQLEEALSFKVTYNSINKYENGLMQPDKSTILELATILKVTPKWFFELDTIELGEINFRKQSSLTKREIVFIEEKTKYKLQRYIETKNLLHITETFYNPIAGKMIKFPYEAEEMAQFVRNEWSLGTNPIPNVIEMLEENGVKVIEINASGKFDGFSTCLDDKIPIAVINESFKVERKRFTALHELGHLMMEIRIDDLKEKKKACHRFAGALLFPEKEVRKNLGDRRSNIALGELVAIKEEYGISVQAIMRRVLDLGIISSSAYKQFGIRIASNRKEEGLGSYPGEEKSTRLLQMVFRLFAERVIDEAKAASLSGVSSSVFRSLYYNIPYDELSIPGEIANETFSKAWGDDEPEYGSDDLLTLNPNYEGR